MRLRLTGEWRMYVCLALINKLRPRRLAPTYYLSHSRLIEMNQARSCREQAKLAALHTRNSIFSMRKRERKINQRGINLTSRAGTCRRDRWWIKMQKRNCLSIVERFLITAISLSQRSLFRIWSSGPLERSISRSRRFWSERFNAYIRIKLRRDGLMTCIR